MKRILLLSLLFIVCSFIAKAQTKNPKDTEVWEPEPRIVTPGQQNTAAPSDAVVLFDGSNYDHWINRNGEKPGWTLADGIMTVVKGTGPIMTKEKFGDCQLHIEWRAPSVVESKGQGRGNSGIFLQERYEVQVLDSYDNRTYSNGQAGSIYKQSMPLVNAMRPPGEWQTYDIIYKAPRFNADGIKTSSAYVTVIHNGVVIQNDTEIKGTTEYIGMPKNSAHEEGSIILQDHS
ncbi:MAG: DUF1080 domain-containing protein, partial [Bacteroidota bacterium]